MASTRPVVFSEDGDGEAPPQRRESEREAAWHGEWDASVRRRGFGVHGNFNEAGGGGSTTAAAASATEAAIVDEGARLFWQMEADLTRCQVNHLVAAALELATGITPPTPMESPLDTFGAIPSPASPVA
jgi:hypothetical protein